MFDDAFVDTVECKGIQDILFLVRQLHEQRRQISITVNADGSAEVSSPMIGNRNPKHPQPTPPTAVAMKKVA